MLEYQKEECIIQSFKLAGSLFCNCGIPFTERFRNIPCYHIFCKTCIKSGNFEKKCPRCDSQVEMVEELHANQDILICTVPNCGQGFLNFPSLKAHSKLSHSVDVNTVNYFYEKFGDVALEIPKNEVVQIVENNFKDINDKRSNEVPDLDNSLKSDSRDSRSPKSRKKNDKS